MKVVLYGIEGKDVVGEQTKEEVLKRVTYGEIVSLLDGRYPQWFIDWCKTEGVNVVCENWEGMAGRQVYIKDEDGSGYDVDGNKIEEGECNE